MPYGKLLDAVAACGGWCLCVVCQGWLLLDAPILFILSLKLNVRLLFGNV